MLEYSTLRLRLIKPCFFRFIEKLQQDIPGKGVKQILEVLCSVYALSLLHKHLGDFISTGCIDPKQGSLASEQLRNLYSQVCPQRFNSMLCCLYFNQLYENSLIILRVFRFVLMQLRLLMHIITLTTTLVQFWDVTMEMCIRSCTRRHGRILWMIRLFLMALKSIFNPCLSNNYAMLDSSSF